MSGDYTKEFGWGSHGAYPAGGCLYINSGQVNTPLLNLTGNDGIFFVKFRARTFEKDAESNYTVIEGAETNGMTATSMRMAASCGQMLMSVVGPPSWNINSYSRHVLSIFST